MKINGEIYNVVLEEDFNEGEQYTCCCANTSNSSSDYNTSCNGSFELSSVSGWSDNVILQDFEMEKLIEEQTVQSPAAIINRSIQEATEQSSGNDNVSIFDRCGTNAGNGRIEDKLEDVLNESEPLNMNSLINTSATKIGITNPLTCDFGPILGATQFVDKDPVESIVKETQLGPNNDYLGSVNMNHDTTLTGPTKHNHPSQKCDLQPRCESIGFDHQINRAGASDQETGSQDCSRNPKLNHMTLIKESILDPIDFQERRQLWVGESSTKQPTTNNCRVKENSKASKRKILSVIGKQMQVPQVKGRKCHNARLNYSDVVRSSLQHIRHG
ncbi:uncharacterized protein LOC114189258 [Vigna unguiculata]|uniref:uncharacterized protein LOC114189258 n=1 Tax=Vigna unguiculata TaxID=3917 RepID=UPI001016F563|nr:uncharacterized protein LOC114189258 [Vigna unguiculata]